jgi:hypothetical protein
MAQANEKTGTKPNLMKNSMHRSGSPPLPTPARPAGGGMGNPTYGGGEGVVFLEAAAASENESWRGFF